VLLDDAVYADELDMAAVGKDLEELESRAVQPEDDGYADWQQQLRWKKACSEVGSQR
jgi:hypothetical protein